MTTQFTGAVVREQGVTFAVVVVKPHIVQDRRAGENAVASFGSVFHGLPVVLMAQDSRGRATYCGRRDIARFLSKLPLDAIPWKRYQLH